jgi:hypothetical protein
MRYARRLIVSNTGAIVHKIWKFHNNSFGLQGDDVRGLFLKCTMAALEHRAVADKIKLQAFCVMSNHSHQLVHSTGESHWLSKFMQIALTKFGRLYNNKFKRSGAVGNGRPKTIPIQETDTVQMRTHMYIEANPIRAGFRKFENLKLYKFSSFRFYAFGVVDDSTRLLEAPEWYIRLGPTPLARQRAYRSLFKKYVGNFKRGKEVWPKLGLFQYFGELNWVAEQLRKLRFSPGSPEIIKPDPVVSSSLVPRSSTFPI